MDRQNVPHADLISACLAYCERAGIKPSTLGHRVANDGQFISRLQGGGRCWPETEARVWRWLDENSQQAAAE